MQGPTCDHNEIRRWATKHGAVPALLTHAAEPIGIDFLFGYEQAKPEGILPVTWETFFARFDVLGLSMAYDAQTRRFELLRVDTRSINQSSKGMI
ncbi:MAG: hypothetical protein ACRYFU_00075 [Janthinobacterium lividum]